MRSASVRTWLRVAVSRFANEPISERLPLYVGQNVEKEALGLPGVMQGQDVRVGQARRDLDLTQKALGSESRCEVGPQDLDRHLAVMPHVVGQVHRGHPPRTQLALDYVAALQGGVQAGNGVGHGSRCA